MIEIDVSGCEYSYMLNKERMCGDEETHYDKCEENKNCQYKQIQQLKAENEALKLKNNTLELKSSSFNLLGLYGRIKQLEQCLDEIKNIMEECSICPDCSYEEHCQSELCDFILKKIKEVRDNEVNS